jgi:hypothetical protein
MTGKDVLFESEDEFFEDFSGWKITDTDLEELLIRARKTSDVRLRRLVKQTQYLRWLMPQLLEIAEQDCRDNNIVKLARAAITTVGTTDREKES